MFTEVEFDSVYASQFNFDIHIDSILAQENTFDSADQQKSIMSLQKRPGWTNFRGNQEKVIATVEIKLSSDHVRYVVQPPS